MLKTGSEIKKENSTSHKLLINKRNHDAFQMFYTGSILDLKDAQRSLQLLEIAGASV